MEVVNIISVILAPIVAVVIGQRLQTRDSKRKDKMQIFTTLMTNRIYNWDINSVYALNMIDVVFTDSPAVVSQWKKYHESLKTEDFKNIELQKCKLLETMASSLGYKDKVTWDTIQSPYVPQGLTKQMEYNKKMADNQEEYYSIIQSLQPIIKAQQNSLDNQKENSKTGDA